MKSTFCQSHLEDYSWENKIGGEDIDIYLGDKDVSSTYGVRIDLVENANTHKHLQSLMVFASFKLN